MTQASVKLLLFKKLILLLLFFLEEKSYLQVYTAKTVKYEEKLKNNKTYQTCINHRIFWGAIFCFLVTSKVVMIVF